METIHLTKLIAFRTKGTVQFKKGMRKTNLLYNYIHYITSYNITFLQTSAVM